MNIDLDITPIDQIGRYLRKKNIPDDELIHVHRSGMPCFVDYTAGHWKALTVRETDKQGIKFAKYVPMPDLWGKS